MHGIGIDDRDFPADASDVYSVRIDHASANYRIANVNTLNRTQGSPGWAARNDRHANRHVESVDDHEASESTSTSTSFLVREPPPLAQYGDFNALRYAAVREIAVDELVELRRQIDELFAAQPAEEGYSLETVEVHVSASADGNLAIASAGVEGGIKLVFQREE